MINIFIYVGLTILAMVLFEGVLKNSDTPRKIPLNLVETGANTFSQVLVPLPNTKGIDVFDLDLVDLRWVSSAPAAAEDTGFVQVQVQRDTGTAPTAMLPAEDTRVLYNGDLLISSGVEAADIDTWVILNEMGKSHVGFAEYITNDQVRLCVEGAAMGGAYRIRGNLIGSIEKLSASQLQALTTAQLG